MQVTILPFLLFFASSLGDKLPSEFKICNRSDSDLNGCLKEAIAVAVFLLKDGLPSFNIPPLEPLKVGSITILGNGGAVNVDQKFQNVLIRGIKDGIIEKVESSFTNKKDIGVVIHGILPYLNIEADYNFSGKLLMVPLVGNGKCYIDLGLTYAVVTLKGVKQPNKKGIDHFMLLNVMMELRPTAAKFKFENLFNGNKRLSSQMHKLINEQWKEVFEEVKDGYIQAIVAVIWNIANKIFKKVPFNELFPQ